MRFSYARVAYIAVLVVLVAMLIGTNYQLASKRDELRKRDELLLKTAVMLNGRMSDLKKLVERAEERADKLLGLQGGRARYFFETEE